MADLKDGTMGEEGVMCCAATWEGRHGPPSSASALPLTPSSFSYCRHFDDPDAVQEVEYGAIHEAGVSEPLHARALLSEFLLHLLPLSQGLPHRAAQGCSHEEKLLLQDALLPSSNPLTWNAYPSGQLKQVYSSPQIARPSSFPGHECEMLCMQDHGQLRAPVRQHGGPGRVHGGRHGRLHLPLHARDRGQLPHTAGCRRLRPRGLRRSPPGRRPRHPCHQGEGEGRRGRPHPPPRRAQGPQLNAGFRFRLYYTWVEVVAQHQVHKCMRCGSPSAAPARRRFGST